MIFIEYYLYSLLSKQSSTFLYNFYIKLLLFILLILFYSFFINFIEFGTVLEKIKIEKILNI